MSHPHEPQPAKLITGLLFRDFDIRRSVLAALQDRFGPMDCLTEPNLFTYTDYYDSEMGEGIYRQTLSFTELVFPEKLADIKLFTNELELRLSLDGKRQANIDPGLLSEERVVLATGKNYTHRIYLRDGIYADLTLIYQAGAYQTLPWTYPDYGEKGVREMFHKIRMKYVMQLKGNGLMR